MLDTCSRNRFIISVSAEGRMSDVILPVSWRYGRIDMSVFAYDLLWRVRPHSRRSPSTPRDADAAEAALIFGHF